MARSLTVVEDDRIEEELREHGIVPVGSLRPGPSPRASGVNQRHVACLVEAGGGWPAILVHRPTMTVIDGLHRLTAATTLGHATIEVAFFDGTEDEAWLEGIKSNTTHGMPLTLTERKVAAREVLVRQPDRSDRSVAALCGLSPSTVRGIRGTVELATPPPAPTRLGRDGRRHPVNSDLHARIERALRAEPELSLRSIARKAGASPETVRSVRKRLFLDQPAAMPAPPVLAFVSSREPVPARRWEDDTACSSTPDGAAFATWFDSQDIRDRDWMPFIDSVPISRVYEIIDDARRRAQVWEGLARRLETRVGR